MHRFTCVLCALTVLAMPLAAQTVAKKSAEQMQKSYEAHKGDFDYLLGDWRFGGSLLYVGDRFDDAANTRPLAAYTTVDLYLDRQLTPEWSVQAKLNNVTDKQYETATGYNQPGRGIFLTLRWQPK